MSPSTVYVFGPFELDATTHRLSREGKSIPLAERHGLVLQALVSHPGAILSKDALITAAWGDIAVTDNSLEQVISSLRRLLNEDGRPPAVETVPRQGYRFTMEVRRVAGRETDDALDALLAPHRAWIEGRAALETLERDHIRHARDVFERALQTAADHPSAHIGLANAWAMQFEMTRGDLAPDVSALARASVHAREACRLDASSAEAWATLGFVLHRAGERIDALAAARRAVMLESDNWRHHFRLSLVGWGEERLRAARRVLALLPGFPLAHFMAATVYVARQALDEAARELADGLAGTSARTAEAAPFSSVALHWLSGLVALVAGDRDRALMEFEREIDLEGSGHLYARECAANCWYAIGVMRGAEGRQAEAVAAFDEALARTPAHALAHLARTAVAGGPPHAPPRPDGVLAPAAALVLIGRHDEAGALVDAALAVAPPGDAGWLLPVEPLFAVASHPEAWSQPLSRLRTRAA